MLLRRYRKVEKQEVKQEVKQKPKKTPKAKQVSSDER